MTNRILIGTLLLLCGLLLFYQVAKNITLDEIYDVFRVLDYTYVIFAWLIYVISTVIRGYKWNLLAGDPSNTRLIFFVNMYIINNITNQILPMKLGELVTPYIINLFDNNCTYLHRLTRLLLDRLIEAALLLLLFIFSVFWLIINAYFLYGILIALFTMFVIAIILLLDRFRPSGRTFIARQCSKVKSKIELPDSGIFKKICLFTLLAYVCDILCFYNIFKAFNVDIGLLKVIMIFSISITIGVLTLIPGGIGIIEMITVQLLNQFGYDNRLSILTSVYIRVISVTFLAVFFIYLIFMWCLSSMAKKTYT